MTNFMQDRSGACAAESGLTMEVAIFVTMLSISILGAHLSLTFGAASRSFAVASQIAAYS
jgi:Flp pilus assembly pilin Flp